MKPLKHTVGWKHRFEVAFRNIVMRGEYPGPTSLNELLHGHRSNSINGRETKLRIELMRYYEVSYRRHGGYGAKGDIPDNFNASLDF